MKTEETYFLKWSGGVGESGQNFILSYTLNIDELSNLDGLGLLNKELQIKLEHKNLISDLGAKSKKSSDLLEIIYILLKDFRPNIKLNQICIEDGLGQGAKLTL